MILLKQQRNTQIRRKMVEQNISPEDIKLYVPWSRYRNDCGCGETLRTDLPEDSIINLDDYTNWIWTHKCSKHIWGEDLLVGGLSHDR